MEIGEIQYYHVLPGRNLLFLTAFHVQCVAGIATGLDRLLSLFLSRLAISFPAMQLC